ncbi:hypothetical protein ACFVW2_05505 [Streptomyces sp. NPDC058171]
MTTSERLPVVQRARTLLLLLVLSVVAATLTGVQPATANTSGAQSSTTLDPLPAAQRNTYKLHPGAGAAGLETYGAPIRAVEATGNVTRTSPAAVALSRQHVGRALCHGTGLNGAYLYDGFCWDAGDDATSAWSGGWHPQGLTASHDAQPGGTVDGHHLYVASWYYGTGETTRDQFARVSFLKSTGTDRSYGHVMLVKPKNTGASATFEAVTNVHADGMVWYGNKLYVANGGELQVYDTQFLWRMESTATDRVGIANGVSSARYHQWALPMVARYVTTDPEEANVRTCPGEQACLGSLSLDRSGPVDHLVSGEYLNPGTRTTHVARWPLNDATDLLASDSGATFGTTTATGVYAVPPSVRRVQGVATDGTRYYLAGQCPDGYMGDANTSDPLSYSCIFESLPGGVPTVLTRSPSLTQNLSYAPSSGRLWGLNEQTNHRVVFSILPSAV